jgi:hypothetical protein
MIVAQISAGIGNQLFQYATARALSLRTGFPLRLDLDYFSATPNRTYRLFAYPLSASVATDEDLARYLSRFHRIKGVRRLAFFVNNSRPWESRRVLVERSPRFDPSVLEVERAVYLAGFWQSERYFIDQAESIRRELTLLNPVPPVYAGVSAMIERTESVGLVVRRGDYVGIPNTQGICTLQYYRNALRYLATKVSNMRVFVFSDDIQWCRENLAVSEPLEFVANETPDRPEEHLRVLSHCRHFVVANSSFAWWGAWLANRPDKIVVAPPKWMQRDKELGDLVPQSWIRLPLSMI